MAIPYDNLKIKLYTYEIAMHEPFTNANEYKMAIPYDS